MSVSGMYAKCFTENRNVYTCIFFAFAPIQFSKPIHEIGCYFSIIRGVCRAWVEQLVHECDWCVLKTSCQLQISNFSPGLSFHSAWENELSIRDFLPPAPLPPFQTRSSCSQLEGGDVCTRHQPAALPPRYSDCCMESDCCRRLQIGA